MKDLEVDYKENKENCEHLIQRRNQLILAAKPLNFMETFRFVHSDSYDPALSCVLLKASTVKCRYIPLIDTPSVLIDTRSTSWLIHGWHLINSLLIAGSESVNSTRIYINYINEHLMASAKLSSLLTDCQPWFPLHVLTEYQWRCWLSIDGDVDQGSIKDIDRHSNTDAFSIHDPKTLNN